MIVWRRQALNASGVRSRRTSLPRLDLRQVQPPRLALVMGRELLEPAAGMLVLRRNRGGAAFLGLLVEESHVVHGGQKARVHPRFPLKWPAEAKRLENSAFR